MTPPPHVLAIAAVALTWSHVPDLRHACAEWSAAPQLGQLCMNLHDGKVHSPAFWPEEYMRE